ncbi:MAG: UbiD family decarboxylase [Acidobacteria bacterium]|nr:UbiD family decarboxylase [Acidobacteriota bacterium]
MTARLSVLYADAVFLDAIYPATVVGKKPPRQESFFIGDYLQELLSPLFPLVIPAVQPLGGRAFAARSGRSRAVVWTEALGRLSHVGEEAAALTKFLLLTDKKRQDLRDFRTLFMSTSGTC